MLLLTTVFNLGACPLTWASNIEVRVEGPNLRVSGMVPTSEIHLEPQRDFFLRYVRSLGSADTQGSSRSPHLKFANAQTDTDLIDFVREFGPVSSTKVEETETSPSGEVRIAMDSEGLRHRWRSAIQSLSGLREEQRMFGVILDFIHELRRGEKCFRTVVINGYVQAIVNTAQKWKTDWEVEKDLRDQKNQGEPGWHFSQASLEHLNWLASLTRAEPCPLAGLDPYLSAHEIVCTVLNSFRTELQFADERPLEALPFDSLRYGIRPALYLALRYEYLKGRIDRCGNDRCNKFFLAQRFRQQFCSPECSLRFRQRQYWEKKGAQRRRGRLAAQKRQRRR